MFHLGNDAREQELLTDDFIAHKLSSVAERLSIVKNLRLAAGMPVEENGRLWQSLEYRESNPSPYGVTLGIEIEVPKEALLSAEKDGGMSKTKKKKFFDEKKKEYQKVAALGIQTDNDQFHEFAHLPAQSPAPLAREVEALMKMGLIDAKYQKYPLHVTVGGIATSDFGNESSADLLARALDATAWCTDGTRLVSPYLDPENSDWTYHGALSGIRERGKKDIKPVEDVSFDRAVEFRTIQLQNLAGLDRYLESIYYLGAALRAKQFPRKDDAVSKELARVWRSFSERCGVLFEGMGLADPRQAWKLKVMEPREASPFNDLAKTLDGAIAHPESPEAKFVHDIRLAVISARKEIKEILEVISK